MNTAEAKTHSRFFTGHYSTAEINSICRSGMGSIRVAKNGSTRRGSLRFMIQNILYGIMYIMQLLAIGKVLSKFLYLL